LRLTDEQTQFLRALARDLLPTVNVGAGGLTKFLLRQIDDALSEYELVKVRVPFGNHQRRKDVLDTLAPLARAEVVSRAHNTAILYRPAATPVIALPSPDS
jgi:RNA-binding protein